MISADSAYRQAGWFIQRVISVGNEPLLVSSTTVTSVDVIIVDDAKPSIYEKRKTARVVGELPT